MRRRVLFVCTANSARSLMAEALLRDMAGDRFDVASAGTDPASPHPLALAALEEAGLSTKGLGSKSLGSLEGQSWDYVITLCERAARECGTVQATAQQIAWDFPDPALLNRPAAFALTLKELKERLGLFTLVHRKDVGLTSADYSPVTVFRSLADELRLTAMLLIRDQGALCVCELTEALAASQPKVSRHLASLRDAGLVETERRGQWVYYHLHPRLPDWLTRVLDETAHANAVLIQGPMARLEAMADRPESPCPQG